MKTNRACMLLVVFVLVATAACGQNAPQTAPPSTVAVAASVPAATVAPPSPTSPPAALQPAADNWDDRAIFRAGLIKDEQKTLDQLPGASVYHLDVQIADDFASLQGQERVRYTNQESQPLEAIYFQLFPNMAGGKSSVSAVQVDGQAVKPIYESENSTVRVPLTTPLQPGQRVVIQMDFKVQVPTEVGGNYGVFGYLNNILVLDGFYPAIPVYDEKGWHAGKVPPNADSTFQDASFYVARVTAPAALTLIASGIQVERAPKDNRQVVTFAAGPARDFYMAASDRFAVISETIGETRVNSYAFKDRTEGSQAALRTAVNAIKSFSARLGAYPYTEFDVVSTPMQGATGIEYPGITGINFAVYDPKATVSGLPAPVMLESTVAHEVGHQWFYNAVGNDQINEPWLDEAVTQYVTGLYFLDLYGRQGMEGYRGSWLSRWDRVNREPIPIGLPAGSYQGKEYGAIVYGRGPLFIEALALKMGQATFDQFLRDYYQSHKWGIGAAASFKQLADKHCQCDLTLMFDEWVSPTSTPMPLPTAALTPLPTLSGSGGGILAFTAIHGANAAVDATVNVMNVDGSNRVTLVKFPGWYPDWSPDGKHIIFHVHESESIWSIYAVNADGSNPQRLTSGAQDASPAWSPDGTRIAFARNGDIWVMRVSDGSPMQVSDLRQLTSSPVVDGAPNWSPDGKQIVFFSYSGTNHTADIAVINADGTNLRRLMDNQFEDWWPAWSPDGQKIAFQSNRDGKFQIYRMNPDGSHVQRVTHDEFNDTDAAWSPDGTRIAFTSDRDGNEEIYVMNSEGSNPIRLTNTPTNEECPAWKPVR